MTESLLKSAVFLKCFGLTLFFFSAGASDARADFRVCQYTAGRDKDQIRIVHMPGNCPRQSRQLQLLTDGYGRSGTDITFRGFDQFIQTELSYRNFTVNPGAIVVVPSGTVIRTTGNFINRGTITVSSGAGGGLAVFGDSLTTLPVARAPHPGVALQPSASGEVVTSSVVNANGAPGGPITNSVFLPLYRRFPWGCGGGAGGFSKPDNPFGGGAGGGSLVIISRGSVQNEGSIAANGEDGAAHGSGGGAGGVIVILSKESITNTASISANGGAGGAATADLNANTVVAPGGGGSGGFVHLIAPRISANDAAISATGGSAGSRPEFLQPELSTRRIGGGAGGNCSNGGGAGGSITDTITAAGEGSPGLLKKTESDPAVYVERF